MSLPNETYSVTGSSLPYRVAKRINCLIETGLGTVDFSRRSMQNVIVKDRSAVFFFEMRLLIMWCCLIQVLFLHFGRSPLVVLFILYLHVFTVRVIL